MNLGVNYKRASLTWERRHDDLEGQVEFVGQRMR